MYRDITINTTTNVATLGRRAREILGTTTSSTRPIEEYTPTTPSYISLKIILIVDRVSNKLVAPYYYYYYNSALVAYLASAVFALARHYYY